MSRSHAARCARHPDRLAAANGTQCHECAGKTPTAKVVADRLERVGLHNTAGLVRAGQITPHDAAASARGKAGPGQPFREERLVLAEDIEMGWRTPRAKTTRRAKVTIEDRDRTAMLRGKSLTVRWPALRPPRGAIKARRPNLVGETITVDVTVLRPGGVDTQQMLVTCTELTDRDDGDYDAVIVAGGNPHHERYLVAQHGVPVGRDGIATGDDGDYTRSPSRAMRGEPAAVSDADQRAITAQQLARYADLQARQQRRRTIKSARAQLQRLGRRADTTTVDMAAELKTIEQALLSAERKLEQEEGR